MALVWVISSLLTSLYCTLWYYLKTTVWCRSQTCLVGKTAIVTGANTGIGYETALDFAKRGAKVILACRDLHKAEEAKSKIIEETGNKNVFVKVIDLTSLDSVRAFAKNVNETEERLDILVNNAGGGDFRDKKTVDGLLYLMQVNYLSSFLLTNLLIGLLKKSAPSRIINVSSILASRGKFDVNNINKFTGIYDYSRSKLCSILFTMELAEKLKGTQISTFSLHPGYVKTDIYKHIRGFYKILVDFFKHHFLKTSEEGAQTTIFTAVAKGIERYSGEHFDNCTRVEPYKTATVPGLPKKLWEISETCVGLKPEEIQF